MKKQLVQRLLLLFILILVPSIIVFLHSFGDNQFALKTYHQDLVQVALPCNRPEAPYSIPSAALSLELGQLSFPTKEINVILALDTEGWREQMNGLNSVISTHLERTKIDVLVLVPGTDSTAMLDWNTRLENFKQAIPSLYLKSETPGEVKLFYECTLFSGASDPELEDADPALPPESMMVLLDRENRVRGYYNSAQKEEFDRLTMEVGVLLTVYKQEEDGK